MTNKIISGLVMVAVLTVGYLYVAQGDSAPTTIRLGGIFSLTGNGAGYGEPARDGFLLAIDEVNASGGVSGKQLVADVQDSQFTAPLAVNAYKSLTAQGVRYFFSNGSSVSLALGPLAVANHNLLFETSAVTPKFADGNPLTCRTTLTADTSGAAIANFLASKLSAKRIAFLTINDDYGGAVLHEVKTRAEAIGIQTVGEESFSKDEKDLRTPISKMIAREKEIDALIVIPAAGQADTFFKQLHELGWKKPIISDNFTIINQQLRDRSRIEGVYFSNYDWQPGVQTSDSPALVAFKTAFQNRFHHDPPANAANAYEGVRLLAQAFQNGASIDNPEATARWMIEHVKGYEGVNGSITLNSDCEASRAGVIFQVQGGAYEKIQ